MAKILVIDDDPALVSSVKELLEMEGHEVITAASGEEGLDMVLKEIPTAIILELMLPGIDGFDVAR